MNKINKFNKQIVWLIHTCNSGKSVWIESLMHSSRFGSLNLQIFKIEAVNEKIFIKPWIIKWL